MQVEEDNRPSLRFKVAGHSEETLWFFPGPTRCGYIVDGVALQNGDTGDWVIRYEDLKTMYEAATAARNAQRTSEHMGSSPQR